MKFFRQEMWPKKEESGRQQEKRREEREIDTQKHTHREETTLGNWR